MLFESCLVVLAADWDRLEHTMSEKNEFTTRTLMALVTELALAQEAVARMAAQIGALAKEHGVEMVEPEPV
jgi:hypothetical protein